jgi:hypothetical protein
MNLVTLVPGDRLADTIQHVTPYYARLLKSLGFRGVLRYVTSVSPTELDSCFAEGLAVGFVTYANDMNITHQLACLSTLGTPKGHHLFSDIEGASRHFGDPGVSVVGQLAQEKSWAASAAAAGIIPARYAGADQRLTSNEQWLLPHRLYWHSCSDVRDRYGVESVPDVCGYAMFQDPKFNQAIAPGYTIDVDKVTTGDLLGRLPILVGG